MFILGILSWVQALLLPGALFTFCLPKEVSKSTRILLSVPLSILLNHYLVIVLALFGFYTQTTMLALFGFQIFLFAILIRAAKLPWKNIDLNALIFGQEKSWYKILFSVLIFYAALSTCIKYTQYWFQDLGSIFSMWDAVVSWNQWGIQWAANKPAHGIVLYPQAMPILYSLPYVFMGTSEIQFFSKAIPGIIFLTALYCLFDLGRKSEKYRLLFFLSTYVFGTLQAKFFQSHWNSGYADLPLACFTVFVLYASLSLPTNFSWKIAGLFAGTASLVKQPGLLLAGVYPILHFLWAGNAIKNIFREWKKNILPALCALLSLAPWYLYIFWATHISHTEGNNVGFLASLVDRDFFGRWKWCLELMASFSSPTYLMICLVLALIGCKNSLSRYYLLLLGIPYFFIWGTFFSYDIRNIAMSVFPFSLAISAGLLNIFFLEKSPANNGGILTNRWSFSWTRAQQKISLILMILFIPVFAATKMPPNTLFQQEIEKELLLGDDATANQALLKIKNDNPALKIFSCTEWIPANPLFHKNSSNVSCQNNSNWLAIVKNEKSILIVDKLTAGKDFLTASKQKQNFILFQNERFIIFKI